MRRTSTCPKCQEPITLPDAPDASLVECPLCEGQYKLAEALDFVAETDEEEGPPELYVVDDGGEELEATEPGAEGVRVRCPCCKESFPLQNLRMADTDAALGPEAASAILADGTVGPKKSADHDLQFRFGDEAGEPVDHSDFQLASAEPEKPAASAEAFEFAAPVAADAEGSGGIEGDRARRRKRERNVFKDFLGAVLGGAAGLVVTYYLLNYFGGARFDFLDVYLPGVEHTALHRPDWLGGPPEEELFDSGLMDPEAEPPFDEPTDPSAPDSEDSSQSSETPPASPPAETEQPAGEDASEPDALPDDYAGLIDPPQATSDQLGQALKDVSRLPTSEPLDRAGYEAWCRLAECATFVDRNDGNPQTQNRLDATRRLLRELTGADVVKIGQWATRLAASPDRASRGILLAGIVGEANAPSGNGYRSTMRVAATGAPVALASDVRLPIEPQDRVLLLGYLVDQPETATQGLETEAPQIVWSRVVAEFDR